MDALRSVQRYVAEILNEPPLAEFVWQPPASGDPPVTPPPLRWSPGAVKGDLPVDGAAWRFLLARRYKPSTRTTSDGVLIGVGELGSDPAAAAALAGVTLPTSGDVVEVTTARAPSWDVVLAGDRALLDYPFCIVSASGSSVSVGNALYCDVTQPMHLTAYPTDAVDDARAAELEAERTRDRLARGFFGGVGLGRPRRIPLYDYDLVGDGETSAVRGAHDFLRVADFGAELLPEPADPRQVAVVADLRVAWRRDAGATRGYRTAESVRLASDLT